MPTSCAHLAELREVVPRSRVCRECEALGLTVKQLRVCLSCGYVGCCETSEGDHASAHHRETGHPVIRSLEDTDDWAWCYIDEVYLGTPTGTRFW